jgi:DNA-directed RNA polymerase II subunit RPB2
VWCGNSRHGQKGTVGQLYREDDMPVASNGVVPAIIMNPHAIPSRMTIGQLMEAIESKAGALRGSTGDATPFNGRTLEDMADELEALGAQRYGDELMYNPRTGEQMPCAVFLCPTYYQRLKHMVADKSHSRGANGPVVLLTRQPAEGRVRDGGLRIGEMEMECLWAHGAMYFLKERFMECSDNYRVFVCRKCGMMATVNPEKGLYLCKACKNNAEFAELRVPYAAKLLLQEVQTMSIGARFVV